jgi:hypothetical protein
MTSIIAFISKQINQTVLFHTRFTPYFLQPIFINFLKTLKIKHIIHNNNCISILIVTTNNASKCLLASRIPDLQLNKTFLIVHRSAFKRNYLNLKSTPKVFKVFSSNISSAYLWIKQVLPTFISPTKQILN